MCVCVSTVPAYYCTLQSVGKYHFFSEGLVLLHTFFCLSYTIYKIRFGSGGIWLAFLFLLRYGKESSKNYDAESQNLENKVKEKTEGYCSTKNGKKKVTATRTSTIIVESSHRSTVAVLPFSSCSFSHEWKMQSKIENSNNKRRSSNQERTTV